MSDESSQNGKQAAESNEEGIAISAKDLATAAGSMNQFLTLLAQNSILKDAKIDLAKWLILETLTTAADAPKIAKNLGFSKARVQQLLQALEIEGFIISVSDGSENFEITEDGTAKKAIIDDALTELLIKNLGPTGRIIVFANRFTKRLTRALI